MILSELTAQAESAAARYGMLTDSWRSIFYGALNSADFGAPSVTQRAIAEAYEIAADFLKEERANALRIINDIAREAHQTTIAQLRSIDTSGLTALALEHLSAIQSYLIDELVAQIHRDIALLRQTIQRVSLEVSIASRSRGIAPRLALIEYRIGNVTELQFVFHDRHARKWASKKFVRAIWRHTLLAVYNEIVLHTLADHGKTHARIVHEDAGADVNGMIIAMGSNNKQPTYSEIRAEVFHPNANAILAMEESDVST